MALRHFKMDLTGSFCCDFDLFGIAMGWGPPQIFNPQIFRGGTAVHHGMHGSYVLRSSTKYVRKVALGWL